MPLLLLCESPLLSVGVASGLMGAPFHGDIDKVENSDNDSLFNATDDHRSRASVQIASSEYKTTDHERVWRLPPSGCRTTRESVEMLRAGSRIVSLDDVVTGLLGEMNGSRGSTDCGDEDKDPEGLED